MCVCIRRTLGPIIGGIRTRICAEKNAAYIEDVSVKGRGGADIATKPDSG